MGLANHEFESAAYLLCWDVHQKASVPHDTSQTPYYSLQPVAHMELGGGLTFERYDDSWAQLQATPESDGVIIAVCASNEHTDVRYSGPDNIFWVPVS